MDHKNRHSQLYEYSPVIVIDSDIVPSFLGQRTTFWTIYLIDKVIYDQCVSADVNHLALNSDSTPIINKDNLAYNIPFPSGSTRRIVFWRLKSKDYGKTVP